MAGHPERLPVPFALVPRGARAVSDVFTAFVAGSEVSRSRRALRMRRSLAGLLFGAAGVLVAVQLASGRSPGLREVLVAVVGASMLGDLTARFLRDWGLIIVGVVAYGITVRVVPEMGFPVHYEPQIAVDRVLGFGTVPTVWLQEALYNGRTGVLEAFAIGFYLSHFFAPLALGLYLWFRRMNRAFGELMFGLLLVSLLADIAFVVAPTAPPWLAAQTGHLPHVHHILKLGLADLGLDGLANLIGDSRRYNIVAAVPSLHAAFPVVALLVVRAAGLSRWIVRAQWLQMIGVFFAIVYTGDHYVADAVAGAAFAALAWIIVRRALGSAARAAGGSAPALPRLERVAEAHGHGR
jgi:hypothetical protein